MPNRKPILVAEDDETDIMLLQRAFLKAGLNPRLNFVRDGQEAIHYLKGEPAFADRTAHPLPHIMLLDLKMPRMDGFAVLDWVRKQPGFKRLIVVVLTTSDVEKDVAKAYELGANSFVTKPSDTSKLPLLAQKLHEYWLETNRCCTVD